MKKIDNILNEKINEKFHHDFIQDIPSELFAKISLIALVSADMQRVLKIPLSDTTKKQAIEELIQILHDNI